MKWRFSESSRKRITHFLLPTLFFAFALWLMFHTFSYNPSTNSMLLGQKVWSDFAQHIAVIRSFSHGANISRLFGPGPVEFPLYAGEGMRYHFLFYAFVGILEALGMRIDWALNIPSAAGFAALLLGIFALAKYLFKDARVAALSVVFFLLNGSLAFLRFFSLHPLSLATLTDIRTVWEFPAFAPWGAGLVSAFWNLNIYTNQRHLALAFAAIIVFILSLLRSEKLPSHLQVKFGLVWGVVFGLFPFFHQPSLLIVGIMVACYFLLFPALRLMLGTVGVVTAALALPQIIPLMYGGAKTFSWYPGYLIYGNVTVRSFLVYWFHNLGFHALLIPLGFFLIPRRAQKTLAPLVAIFVVANLFKFSVEAAANHKFFNFALILGSMISAYVVVQLYSTAQTLRSIVATAFVQVLVVWLVVALTFSGVIDFFVVANDTKGAITDVAANRAASWIENNTPKDAVFLNSSYMYHPASLAGRSIFLGWPYFAWSAGYEEDRMPIMQQMYEGKDPFVYCPLFARYGIDYITVEDTHDDPNLPRIDTWYFFSSFTPMFTTESYGIFTTDELCN